jgi:uncharacterized damage-inducible protein DinB
MDILSVLLAENDRIHSQLASICSDLTDAQAVFTHEAVDERGISHVVVHLYGAILNRARIIIGLDALPEAEPPRTTKALMAYIDDTHAKAKDCLAEASEDELDKVFEYGTRHRRQSPGIELIMAGFAHANRHTGQILDARHLGGFETHALG